MRRRVVPLLALLCLSLAFSLGALWIDGSGNLRNVRWEPPEPRQPDFAGIAPALPSQSPAGANQFVATLERPLFSPNRRPPPSQVAAVAAPSAPPPDPLANVQLLGLYAGDNSGGIIARVDGKARRISLNERVGDWTVTSIKQREVTLTRPGETRVLTLETKRPATADTPTPAVARTADRAAQPASDPLPTLPTAKQQIQDEERARLARRNALRAKAGLPPVPE